MMKKINSLAVLTAVVASMFSACTNTEEVVMEERRALDFSVFTNKTTRAPETQGSLQTDGKSFGVWGYSTFGTDVTNVFLNQPVTYDGTAKVWEYSPLKYWDKLSSYELYAYYPYQSSGVTISDDVNKNITVTDFTVAPLVANHVDLMLAGKVTQAVGAAINKVTFNFNHLLSNINLVFKKDIDIDATKVTLMSVKIYGMSKKGTFVQTQSPNFFSGNWTVSTSASDIVQVDDSDLEELANSNVLANTDARAEFKDMLYIPQNTNTLKLDVTYTLGENGAEQPFSRTLDLSYDATDRAYNPTSWGQNQKITYNFTINANVIEFDNPKVEDWATNQDVEVPTIE
ncbi:fimbrillin family protein [uncultured Bacteroides sp.]|uniref:fimbrillin family protein n=1 Tax=uncultured Bacteroides sp. TaxID=162156 RepID=UPI0025F4F647|nr:fimbrillin family protein [uncultured Bacteroides sp.]